MLDRTLLPEWSTFLQAHLPESASLQDWRSLPSASRCWALLACSVQFPNVVAPALHFFCVCRAPGGLDLRVPRFESTSQRSRQEPVRSPLSSLSTVQAGIAQQVFGDTTSAIILPSPETIAPVPAAFTHWLAADW